MTRAAAGLAALLLFALLLVQLLTDGPLTRVDRELMLLAAAHRSGWLTTSMLWVAELHRTVPVLAATAFLAALLAWRAHAAWAWMLAAVPSGMLLNVGLKNLFIRPRPLLDEPLVHLTTFSFPSGHAVAATLFYGSLCLLVLAHERRRGRRAAAVVIAMVMVALVCSSRIYLGAHFLSDVLAGVCVGVAWLAAWTAAVRRLAPGRRPSFLS